MKLVESEQQWVEVRPFITAELESANFAPVIDVLYNLAKPYRFLVVNEFIFEGLLTNLYLRAVLNFLDSVISF